MISTISAVVSHTRDAYAADWTAEFVIEHLKTSGNKWPSSWADLEDEYTFYQSHDYPFSFAELQDLVDVRWDTDASAVANSDPPMTVITLTSGSSSHFEGSEPNALVRDYLSKTLLPPAAAKKQ